ncbi:Ltp family lipoprotein [Vagococcus luciliae]|uniref:Putative host cell surface-exposed lipoprotein Ltp-like HTH region domain-containing protein n=1 Tax=Vagococcus luciliae TaxID=2920380 RepID=A0ABY5P1X3_9ENTE|nr:Ltp family lipoprotein [Vagococcus luciliae]UUV99914.1 hypothetical protein G314FT_20830 [Vagococcus luciliae]
MFFKKRHYLKNISSTLMLIFCSLILMSCGTTFSDEQIIEMWDNNVSLVSNFNINLIQNENITEKEILDSIKDGKKEINKSTEILDKANGNKEQIRLLIKINNLIISTYNYSEKLTKRKEPTDNELQSSYNLGAETKTFADKYNKGILPKSFTKLISLSNRANYTAEHDTEPLNTNSESEDKKLQIKLENSQFEAYPGDKIIYKGTTEPNAEIGLGSDFDHVSDDDGNFEFEYIVPELHTTGITNPVNVRKGSQTGMHGSYIKVLKKEDEVLENVPEENKKALSKATEYNNSVPMSKREMFNQLTQYENFTDEQAQYAVDNMTVDWKKNALKNAKIYKIDMNMSNEEIKEQLISEAGNKYTEEEAKYAIDNLPK